MVPHISRDIHIGSENSRIAQQGVSRTRAQRDRAHRDLKFSRHTHPRRGRGKEVGDHSGKPPECHHDRQYPNPTQTCRGICRNRDNRSHLAQSQSLGNNPGCPVHNNIGIGVRCVQSAPTADELREQGPLVPVLGDAGYSAQQQRMVCEKHISAECYRFLDGRRYGINREVYTSDRGIRVARGEPRGIPGFGTRQGPQLLTRLSQLAEGHYHELHNSGGHDGASVSLNRSFSSDCSLFLPCARRRRKRRNTISPTPRTMSTIIPTMIHVGSFTPVRASGAVKGTAALAPALPSVIARPMVAIAKLPRTMPARRYPWCLCMSTPFSSSPKLVCALPWPTHSERELSATTMWCEYAPLGQLTRGESCR